MSRITKLVSDSPLPQLAISNRYVTPPKDFVEFKKDGVEQSVVSRFEQQVKQYPDFIAVKEQTQTLTYTQLNQAANRLARAILTLQGEAPGPIAILLETSATYVVAILSVLKTSKIYVPLDPSFPRTRLSYIVEDSQVALIVTNTQNLVLARELATEGCPILNKDEIESDITTHNLDREIAPDAPAYLIYTSGSTGKPKGVVQTHHNLLHNSRNQINTFHVCPGDRMTLLYSCSVMGAVRCIFNALLSGAGLYPLNIKNEGLTKLAELLVEEDITICHTIATLFRHFVSLLPETKQFPSLRVLILGGEMVLRREVNLYKKYFSDHTLLYTGLGSTEAGTLRYFIIHKQTLIPGSIVPAGYAVEDMNVVLLDESGHEVEPGYVGEIVVRSPYVALGYWRNPELTRQVFLPDPTGGNVRTYYTGDLGRLEPDGCLYNLGRKDFQVKIRGFRVEVTEVEMALFDSNLVKEAVVTVVDNPDNDKRLVAYVVPAQPALTLHELRCCIQERLPDYMVPSTFVFLKTLPLTPNGKIDRRALPAPDSSHQESKDPKVTPRNEMERQLTEIWETVLNIRPIGVRDNFFELGGNSLLAVRLVAEIEKVTQKKLPLAALFQLITIEKLASLLKEEVVGSTTPNLSPELLPLDTNDLRALLTIMAGREGARPRPDSLMIAIRPTGWKPPLFCCANDVREISTLACYLGEEQPFYLLESGYSTFSRTKGQRTEANIKAIAACHVRDLLTLYPEGPYLLTGYSFGRLVAYEVAKQLQERGKKVALLAILDTSGSGWMYRYYLEELEPALVVMKNELFRGSLVTFARQLSSLLWKVKDTLTAKKSMSPVGANKREYLMQGYLSKITLFLAQEAPFHIKIRRWLFPSMGWEKHVVELIRVTGNHHSMLTEPHGQVLADRIKACIAKALATGNSNESVVERFDARRTQESN